MATATETWTPRPSIHRDGVHHHEHHRHEHHRHAGLHDLAIGCAISGVVLVCIGDPLHADAFSAVSASIAEPIAAAESIEPLESDVAQVELTASISEAIAALDASEGRVLDDAVRTDLADRIAEGESVVREAELLAAVAEQGALSEPGAEEVAAQRELVADLDADAAAVATAVTAWEAEQARIAAEREAARRAAELAAARALPRVRPAGVAAAPAGPFVEGIWTSGGQAEIDACRGSVNMPDVAGYLGGGFYAAEHWSCGGRSWAGIGQGALVSFPGYGIYEVAGQVGGLPSGSSASAVPSGYDGYYQTCMNGNVNNLHVWLLTRVG